MHKKIKNKIAFYCAGVIYLIFLGCSSNSAKDPDIVTKGFQHDSNQRNRIIQTNEKPAKPVPGKLTLVDYKSDRLKIFIGDNYKVSDKLIDWQWASLDDPDEKNDSTGKDAFMYLGEPLIRFNNGEWLPALFIETDKNIITGFSCSVLFGAGNSSKGINDFLQLLSKDISELNNEKIITALKRKGVYETTKNDCIVVFRLITGRALEDDKFEYSIGIRQ